MKMKYEELFEYISYFEDDRNEFYTWESPVDQPDGYIRMPYPKYDEKLVKFVDEVYKTDMMMKNYLEFLESNFGSNNNVTNVIERADLETLRAVLTYYVRQERFCNGLWGTAAKEGIFLKILKKIKATQ